MASKDLINPQAWEELSKQFLSAEPFNHIVIDNFFKEDVALNIFNDMPDYDGVNADGTYDSSIEKKKLFQNWLNFPKNVYQAINYMVGQTFTDYLKQLTHQEDLQADYGLHGGGIHMHKSNDYLNVHLDYDIHPKLDMKRKLNLIIYLTPDWKEEWGGCLQLWSHDTITNQPKECIKKIVPFFNRAVIFDTTQNSWHGVLSPICPPEGIFRKSLALYYVIPTEDTNSRKRALFAPTEEQKTNEEVLNFIKKRSEI